MSSACLNKRYKRLSNPGLDALGHVDSLDTLGHVDSLDKGVDNGGGDVGLWNCSVMRPSMVGLAGLAARMRAASHATSGPKAVVPGLFVPRRGVARNGPAEYTRYFA